MNKTKNLNKVIILALLLITLMTSVVTFSACGKFKPKELTVKESNSVLTKALSNLKTANNIYMVDKNNENVFQYANALGYYSKDLEEGDNYDEDWYVLSYLNGTPTWLHYINYSEWESARSDEIYNEYILDATTGVEVFYFQLFNAFEQMQLIAGKQTANDTYEMTHSMTVSVFSAEYNTIIKDGYITSITLTYSTYEGEELIKTETKILEYNTTGRTIPEIPLNQ